MIRRVELQDAAQIAKIYNQYVLETPISFEETPVSISQMRMRILRINRTHPYLVYQEAGFIVGYAYAHPWKERTAYRHTLETTVYITPEACGKGIGTQLMQALLDQVRTQKAHALIACITTGNQASIRLHTKFGFQKVSTFKQVGNKFGEWYDVEDYELIL